MQGFALSRRLPTFVITCVALMAALASTFYLQSASAHAAGFVSGMKVHSHYIDDVQVAADGTIGCRLPTAIIHCYGPKQIRNAYNIQPLLDAGITGKGRTIVILDAYQAPTIQNDLKLFDQTFGLPNSTLNIIAPDGLTPFDPTNPVQVGWAGEISLDVEWSHVVAPDATIDLVLGKSSSNADLVSALNYAVQNNLGDVISMSFGENEACLDAQMRQAWHNAFFQATLKGITLFASSGDTGAAQLTCDGNSYVKAVSHPAVDPLVTGVGGTQLTADLNTGAYGNEVVWNEPGYQGASGGGFSTIYRKPFYQSGTDAIGKYRGVPDVAYSAAVNGGVAVLWSEGSHGANHISTFGGTSVGSPQWAGIIALADQFAHKRLGFINLAVYVIGHTGLYSRTFHDITSGNNTITLLDANGNLVTIDGYSAQKGWDPTTGWGSPRVAPLVPVLAELTFTYAKDRDTQLPKMQ